MINNFYSYNEYSFTSGNADFVFFSDSGFFSDGASNSSLIHSHKYCELFYILDGDMTLYTENGCEHIFSEGNCVLVSSDVLHTSKISDNSRRIALSFTVKKNLHPGKDFFSVYDSLSGVHSFENFSGIDAFRRIANYYCGSFSDKTELITSCLQEIVILIKASLNEEFSSSQEFSPDSNTYRNYTIETYLNTYYKNGSLTGLSSVLHLSPQQTQRIIKKIYNKTFREKITESKMTVAKSLLLNTGYSISQIAAELGYQNANNFSCAFKNYYKITPKKYKKSL